MDPVCHDDFHDPDCHDFTLQQGQINCMGWTTLPGLLTVKLL